MTQPAGAPPAAENPPAGGMSVADLEKKNKDLEKQLKDKETHIQDLSSTNSALEERLNNVNNPPPPATPPAAGTPPAAAPGINPDQMAQVAKNTIFIERIKEANKDLVELGLEIPITIRANELIKQGKTLEEALPAAVQEFRTKIETKIPPATPRGAQGEGGGNPPPGTPPETPETQCGDEGDERSKRRMQMGL